jgi:ribosomal-protein-alanine N-acetyltransferase
MRPQERTARGCATLSRALTFAERIAALQRSWETDRLLLRLLGPDAAAVVREYGLRSAQFQKPFDPIRPPDFWELPVVADRLVCQEYEAEQDRSLCLVIVHKSDPDRVLGAVNLRNIIRGAMQGATIGYGLAPDAVGHGYMTESVKRVVEIAFYDLALHRVEVNIMPRNAPSLAVVQRAGFIREGLSPHYLQINGVWEDHVRFARIAPEPGR